MTLETVSHRKVRAVMRENSEATEQLAIAAMRGQTHWTLAQWTARLAELDSCSQSVAEFLALND